jgi:hypothetical protein
MGGIAPLSNGDPLGKDLEGLGFERVGHIPGSTYKDNSTIIIVPTRGIERHRDTPDCAAGDHHACWVPFFHQRVVHSWQSLIAPMNQKRAFLYSIGHEVGHAYTELVKGILGDPNLSKWQYIMTLEDDNVVPPDSHIRLLESIEWGKFDAVSGIYFTKGDVNMPQAFGDPEEYRRTGVIDFRPRDIRGALEGRNIMEVNGIAMGCALWRMDLFRAVPPPWFVTVADVLPGKGPVGFTQDLNFCMTARKAGKRFGIDFRVRVGHLDLDTGMLY